MNARVVPDQPGEVHDVDVKSIWNQSLKVNSRAVHHSREGTSSRDRRDRQHRNPQPGEVSPGIYTSFSPKSLMILDNQAVRVYTEHGVTGGLHPRRQPFPLCRRASFPPVKENGIFPERKLCAR